MNRGISGRHQWAVVVCVVILLGHGLFGQKSQPEDLDLVAIAELAGRRGGSPPAKDLGDRPVEVRAADYSPDHARRTFVPLMPGSVAVGDANGDGIADLYITGSGRPGIFLKGEPDGRFRDITDLTRTIGPEGNVSAAFSDYDHSGRESLFISGPDGIRLYRNKSENTFSEVTRTAGLQSIAGILFASVVLGDLDGDGFPDLLAVAYTNLNHRPSKPVFSFPNDFPGAASRLYRNNGNGTFTDVTESSGIGKNPGRARKAILADFNNDRRLDILLLRDDKPPALYLSRGGMRFEEATWDAGDDLTTHAFFEGAVADFNLDGKTDLALWSTHSFRVLTNEGKATFERADSKLLPDPAISLFGFRGAVADLDNDGRDDVLTVDQRGHLRGFVNRSGAFREVSLSLPPGFEGCYLAPVPLKSLHKMYLLAIQTDGRVTLLLPQTKPGL